MVLLAIWVTATMQIARNHYNLCINGLWDVAFHIRVSKMVANVTKMYIISTNKSSWYASMCDFLCFLNVTNLANRDVQFAKKWKKKHDYGVDSNQNICSHSSHNFAIFFWGGGGVHIYLTYVLVNTFLTFFYDAALNFFLSKVIESDSGSELVRDVTEFDSLIELQIFFLVMFD